MSGVTLVKTESPTTIYLLSNLKSAWNFALMLLKERNNDKAIKAIAKI